MYMFSTCGFCGRVGKHVIFKMIYGICSVLDLIFKDDNSKCAFVYYCFVLGGGLLLVDHCHWDILYTHST